EGNFAGLPGGSCSALIQTLESLLHDARRNRKELWILSQDISKAFDSINLQMLELAMDRLKIPSLCQQFVIGLFTNRSNRVITPFGLTDPYYIKIGIDQGETISPLLWVIYYDPLLTALKEQAIDLYNFEHSKIVSVNPYITELLQTKISSLVFMDDSTLVSTSKK